jgi:hypothetical protein
MKQLINNYTFNPTGKTIVFNDYTSIGLGGLLMITNISNPNKPVLYQFNNSGLTATIVGNVVFLGYNTTLMNSSDILQIFYDDTSIDEISSEEALLLRKILKIMESNGTVDSSNRQKIAVEVMPTTTISGSLTTVTTVSTVSSLTSLSQIASVDARYQIIDWARVAYNTLRSNITFN